MRAGGRALAGDAGDVGEAGRAVQCDGVGGVAGSGPVVTGAATGGEVCVRCVGWCAARACGCVSDSDAAACVRHMYPSASGVRCRLCSAYVQMLRWRRGVRVAMMMGRWCDVCRGNPGRWWPGAGVARACARGRAMRAGRRARCAPCAPRRRCDGAMCGVCARVGLRDCGGGVRGAARARARCAGAGGCGCGSMCWWGVRACVRCVRPVRACGVRLCARARVGVVRMRACDRLSVCALSGSLAAAAA